MFQPLGSAWTDARREPQAGGTQEGERAAPTLRWRTSSKRGTCNLTRAERHSTKCGRERPSPRQYSPSLKEEKEK
jgi:hypothetical protein